MSLLTPFLKLFKWDTTNETDLESEFNIDKSMNENWDKLDTKAQEHENKILDIEDSIEDIQNKDTELEAEIQELEKDIQANSIIEETEQAKSLYIPDASGARGSLTVEGNAEQETRSGKNIFDGQLEDGSINSEGEYVADNSIRSVNFIKLSANKKYCFSNDGVALTLHVILYNTEEVFQEDIGNMNNYTPTQDCCIKFWRSKSSYNKIQIEQNDTVTSWEAYGAMPSPQYPSEIKVLETGNTEIKKTGKNIMPILNLGTNWEYTDRGIKNLKSNVGSTITKINLKKGQTIKIGFKIFTKPTSSTTFTGYIDGQENGNIMFNNINNFTENQLYTKTYTATKDRRLSYQLWGNDNSDTFEFQLWAEFDTLTNYEQYKEDVYDLDIQQNMLKGDSFDLVNSKEIHNWKKIVFKGTEQWSFYDGSTAPFGIYTADLVLPPSQQEIPAVMCNQYKACKWVEVSSAGDYLVSNSGGANFLRFRDINCSTLDEFKAKLAEQYSKGTPVELWYKSTQKTELDLTDTQIEILEKLNKLRFYKGVNNIFTIEDIALLQAKYSVDIQTKLNNINSQLLELGGN